MSAAIVVENWVKPKVYQIFVNTYTPFCWIHKIFNLANVHHTIFRLIIFALPIYT